MGKTETNDINKLRWLEASVLIDVGSPINAGSLLNAGVLRSVF